MFWLKSGTISIYDSYYLYFVSCGYLLTNFIIYGLNQIDRASGQLSRCNINLSMVKTMAWVFTIVIFSLFLKDIYRALLFDQL